MWWELSVCKCVSTKLNFFWKIENAVKKLGMKKIWTYIKILMHSNLEPSNFFDVRFVNLFLNFHFVHFV